MKAYLLKQLNYAKEQFEVGNYGRVEKAVYAILKSRDETYLEEALPSLQAMHPILEPLKVNMIAPLN